MVRQATAFSDPRCLFRNTTTLHQRVSFARDDVLPEPFSQPCRTVRGPCPSTRSRSVGRLPKERTPRDSQLARQRNKIEAVGHGVERARFRVRASSYIVYIRSVVQT